ncbi:MAG: hypothetical protein SD837_06395 [Candidatus Electrothrix scaldis]|nr:MAG: hypothetical protein SD837_06395 [Candidatus Electrothrix sp. GW3-3]
MKVADTDSKLGRKLETWVVREKKEEAIPKLKRKLENWLTEEERKEQFYVVEEKKRLSRKVLMATNKRLVLFDNNIFGMLKLPIRSFQNAVRRISPNLTKKS